MYQPRTYRHWVKNPDLVTFSVIEEETDCSISAVTNLERKARKAVHKYREILKKYIAQNPVFLTTLEPFSVDSSAPQLIQAMCSETAKVGVGPMASVAGAIADFVGRELIEFSSDVIIENGGDIYIKSDANRLVGIFAGKSPFSGKIGIEIKGHDTPLGISTSSGTVGHSLSFGKADAVTVLADSATLSDSAATAIGNMVIDSRDISKGIDFAKGVAGLNGILIIKDEDMGVWGELEICKIDALAG